MSEREEQLERYSLEDLPAGWDAWVASSPEGSPFATTTFLRAFAGALGAVAEVWILRKGDNRLAALPLLHRKRFGRKSNQGIPLVPYIPVIFGPAVLASTYSSGNFSHYLSIVRRFLEPLAREYGSVNLRLMPGALDARPWLWAGWSARPDYTYIIQLTAEPRFARASRRSIRKAQEAGVTLDLAWDLETHCRLLRGTTERQGIWIGMPHDAFCQAANALAEAGLALMATARDAAGEPMASRIELGIPGTATVYDWTAGTNPRNLSLGASAWLMAQIFDRCAARGWSQWDLCGASYENIAKYKSEFGGDLRATFSLASPRTLPEAFREEGLRFASRALRACGWRRRGSAGELSSPGPLSPLGSCSLKSPQSDAP
jgi:hypothetical protein